MAKKLFALSLVLVMILAITACAPKQSEEDKTVKDTLILGHWGDPPTLDPNNALNDCAMRVTTNVYDTLIRMNSHFEPEGYLAESWTVSDDGYEYTFKIREGVKFHNGDLLTVEDVYFSIDRGINTPKSSPSYSHVASVEIVDDQHVKVVLNSPSTIALAKLALPFGPILSKKYVEEVGEEELGRKPMGTGPFKFVEWVKGEKVVLEANENYFKGAPAIKQVTLIVIPDTNAALLNLESGDIDAYSDILTSDYEIAKQNENVKVNEGVALGYELIEFNLKKEPFNDVRVRQAICHAIDKDGLLAGINEGVGQVVHTSILSDGIGYTDKINVYEYDLDKARALLKEAGYEDGFSCDIHVYMDLYSKYAQVLQSSLGEIGIKAEIKQEEISAYNVTRQGGKYDMTITGCSFTAMDVYESTADGLMTKFIGVTNHSGYSNEKLDALFEEALLTTDTDKLGELYEQILIILSEDVPQMPIIWRERNIAAHKNLQIPFIDPYGFHFLYEWKWVGE